MAKGIAMALQKDRRKYGTRVQGLGFKAWDAGFMVQDLWPETPIPARRTAASMCAPPDLGATESLFLPLFHCVSWHFLDVFIVFRGHRSIY